MTSTEAGRRKYDALADRYEEIYFYVSIDIPKSLPSAAAMWDWLAMQGVPDALATLPPGRAEAFRERFFEGAEGMCTAEGIVLEFGATLHRALLA